MSLCPSQLGRAVCDRCSSQPIIPETFPDDLTADPFRLKEMKFVNGRTTLRFAAQRPFSYSTVGNVKILFLLLPASKHCIVQLYLKSCFRLVFHCSVETCSVQVWRRLLGFSNQHQTCSLQQLYRSIWPALVRYDHTIGDKESLAKQNLLTTLHRGYTTLCPIQGARAASGIFIQASGIMKLQVKL